MQTTIDKAGRIVVPKQLRDSLGLSAGSAVEVMEAEGELIVRPVNSRVRVEKRDGRSVLVADGDVAALTVDQVRDLVERTRR